LGNFSVNRYSRLELSGKRIQIHYVLDMAEIPTFQERSLIDVNKDGAIQPNEQKTCVKTIVPNLHRGLYLTINGAPTILKPVAHELTFAPGQAGLSTLRLYCLFEATLPRPSKAGRWKIEYQDNNYSNRIGWKEIIARPLQGVKILESNVPEDDETDALRRYPEDVLFAPPAIQTARLIFTRDENRSTIAASGFLPWLGAASGLIVIFVGVTLIVRRFQAA
jgi:hypothetical protein